MKLLIRETECLKLLGEHCWIMVNAVATDISGEIAHPPRFKRVCKHCETIEFKTMEEMLKEGSNV